MSCDPELRTIDKNAFGAQRAGASGTALSAQRETSGSHVTRVRVHPGDEKWGTVSFDGKEVWTQPFVSEPVNLPTYMVRVVPLGVEE